MKNEINKIINALFSKYQVPIMLNGAKESLVKELSDLVEEEKEKERERIKKKKPLTLKMIKKLLKAMTVDPKQTASSWHTI